MALIQAAVVPLEGVERLGDHVDRVRLDLLHVTAALQVQVTRDFGPLWGVNATVSLFERLQHVPPGYLPVILVPADVTLPRLGLHYAAGGRPLALVQYNESWSVMASHELLEMLSDPWGSQTVPGTSLVAGQGQVEYVLEICDPVQLSFYTINGVLVSDFVTPEYYAPGASQGARYSFAGGVTTPRAVMERGYVTWRVPEQEMLWQQYGPYDPATPAPNTRYEQLQEGTAAPTATDWEGQARPLGSTQLSGPAALRAFIDANVPDGFTVPAPIVNASDLVAAFEQAKAHFAQAQEAYEDARSSADQFGNALQAAVAPLTGEPLPPDAADERAKMIRLMQALGTTPPEGTKDWRATFQTDPAQVFAEAGLSSLAVGFPTPPSGGFTLADKAVFDWAADQIANGDGFGQSATGPFWWIGILAGG